MLQHKLKNRRHFSAAAREAALLARAAKRALPDRFGEPDVFIVRNEPDRAFTWELRRFGGIVLQRGEASFPTAALAKAAGAAALRDAVTSAAGPVRRPARP